MCFLLLSIESPLYILDTSPLSNKHFILLSDLSFHPFTGSSVEQQCLIPVKSNVLIFFLMDNAFGVKSKNP